MQSIQTRGAINTFTRSGNRVTVNSHSSITENDAMGSVVYVGIGSEGAAEDATGSGSYLTTC